MSFLHAGLAAAGFACVAIPIVIHLLFRRRRKPAPWAAMRFLLEAMRRQRRRLRLETLLLLAARCLMLACLAAAIARPLLSGESGAGSTGGRDVYLLIDNSIASRVRDASGAAALARHTEAARNIVEGLRASDRAGLVTLAGPAESVVIPASSDARAVAGLVDGLVPADSAADLAGALDRVGATLRSERASVAGGAVRPAVVHLFSDFFAGSADLSRPITAAFKGLEGVTLVVSRPAAASVDNIQVGSVEPLRSVVISGQGGAGGAAEAAQVRVTLKRTGALAAGVTRVRLRTTDEDAGVGSGATVRWEQGQSEASATVQLESGARPSAGADAGSDRGADRVLVVEIDRDALEADNVRRRPVEVRDRLSVAVIAQRTFGAAGRADRLSSADWFRLALRPSESAPIEVTDIEPAAVDAPSLASVDAVVVPSPDLLKDDAWTRLRRFADLGGLVIVTPPETASVHLWADRFLSSMGLGWRIAREASVADGAPMRLAPFDGSGNAASGAGDGASVFALVAQEMQELTRPVGVTRWLALEDPAKSSRPLLTLADGTPWMLASRVGVARIEGDAAGTPAPGRGLVVLLASAPVLSWTDLPARPLMVPLVQELVRQGVGEGAAAAVAVAGQPVSVPQGAVELRRLDSERAGTGQGAEAPQRFSIGASGVTDSPLRSAGVWRANDAAGRLRGVVVVNPDAAGARSEAQSPDAVRQWLQGAFGGAEAQVGDAVVWSDEAGRAGAAASDPATRSAWTLPLFIAALLLAVAELAMARWFSHAHRERETTRPLPSMLDEVMGGGLSSEARP